MTCGNNIVRNIKIVSISTIVIFFNFISHSRCRRRKALFSIYSMWIWTSTRTGEKRTIPCQTRSISYLDSDSKDSSFFLWASSCLNLLSNSAWGSLVRQSAVSKLSFYQSEEKVFNLLIPNGMKKMWWKIKTTHLN